MKKLCIGLLLLLGQAWAQNAGATIIDAGNFPVNHGMGPGQQYLASYDRVLYLITRAPNGVKTLTFNVEHCREPGPMYAQGLLFFSAVLAPGTTCTPDSESQALTFSPVQNLIGDFLNDDSDAPHKIVYGSTSLQLRPKATEQPGTPPDPYMICLDGFTNNVVKFDMSTGNTLAQVALPSGASGPLALRPASTPPSNEVWVANGTTQVTIADLGAQKVITSIATQSLPGGNVAGIAFTNDGASVLEALSFYSPDSSGNTGAVVAYDAVKRVVTSTLRMKTSPSAFLMSPDGLTAYILDGTGKITYYDVLSGTADLTVSTFTPGVNNGYPGAASSVFVHPDGTRMFWHVGPNIESFDLTGHKVTATYNSGLPTTSASDILMSADGGTISISNGAGNTVIIETHFGNIMYEAADMGATQYFMGPGR